VQYTEAAIHFLPLGCTRFFLVIREDSYEDPLTSTDVIPSLTDDDDDDDTGGIRDVMVVVYLGIHSFIHSFIPWEET
jgi:hypothetical protein